MYNFFSTGEALDIYQIIEITKGSLAKGRESSMSHVKKEKPLGMHSS